MKKKMKAQKLGLVLGMNMAVACMVMQGCKAVKPETDLPPPEVTTIDQPAQQPVDQPVVTEIETTTTPAPSVPGGAVQQETMPAPAPKTRTVSKLPPPAKPAEAEGFDIFDIAEDSRSHTVAPGDILGSAFKEIRRFHIRNRESERERVHLKRSAYSIPVIRVSVGKTHVPAYRHGLLAR